MSIPPRYEVMRLIPPNIWHWQHVAAISPNAQYIAGGIARRFSKALPEHIVRWQEGKLQHVAREIGLIPIAINNHGIIIGRDWRTAYVAGRGGNEKGYELLFPKSNKSFAVAIDDAGNIYGGHEDAPEDGIVRAYKHTGHGETIYLDTKGKRHSKALAVNAKQQVALLLTSRDYKKSFPAIWSPEEGLRELISLSADSPSSCYVWAINNHGNIVGSSNANENNSVPVIWKNGIPEPLPFPEERKGVAIDINDRGEIIGLMKINIPFLIYQGAFYLLNDLVPPHVKVHWARRVLEDGSIFASVSSRRYPSPCRLLKRFFPRRRFLWEDPAEWVLLKPV